MLPTRKDDAWLAEFRSHNADLRTLHSSGNRPDLVFVGDSITKRWNPVVLNFHFASYKPKCLGISGDKIENLLWRLENYWYQYFSPKVVVILIGTNNLATNLAEIPEGILQTRNLLHEKLPNSKLLLLGLLPRAAYPHEQRRLQAALASGRFSVHSNSYTTYMDVSSVFLDYYGRLREDLMPDFLHPNEAGYDALANAIKPTIANLAA